MHVLESIKIHCSNSNGTSFKRFCSKILQRFLEALHEDLVVSTGHQKVSLLRNVEYKTLRNTNIGVSSYGNLQKFILVRNHNILRIFSLVSC